MSIRVIHIGVGGRGVWPWQLFKQRDDFESVALVDIHPEKFGPAMEGTGLGPDRCFDTLEKAMGAVEADAVFVITPPQFHTEHCLAAVKASKHLFVEKPFTMSLADCIEVMKVADANGVKVCVGQQVRCAPACATMARLIREGTCGAVSFGIMTKFSWRPGTHHSGDIVHSYLWERGVHDLDTLRAIFNNEAVRVSGHSFNPSWSPYRHGGGTHAIIEFANGASVSYLCTFSAHGRGSDLRIECEKGCLRDLGDRLEITRIGQDEPEHVTYDERRQPEMQLLDGFCRYIETGEEPPFGGHENLKTIALIDAVLRASDEQRVVEL